MAVRTRGESTAGEIWTFAQDSRGRLRPERGQEGPTAGCVYKREL